MADALVILDSPGPLPLKVSFDSPGDGSVIFVLSGTAFTQNGGVLIGFNLFLDGSGIGKPALCYANLGLNHQAMRTTLIPVDNLAYGSHTIEIAPIDTNTLTDFNDYFQVTMLY